MVAAAIAEWTGSSNAIHVWTALVLLAALFEVAFVLHSGATAVSWRSANESERWTAIAAASMIASGLLGITVGGSQTSASMVLVGVTIMFGHSAGVPSSAPNIGPNG